MAVFLGVHKLIPGMTDVEVQEGYAKYKQSAMQQGLQPLGAVYSMEKGFAYCQTQADSADAVRQAHQNVAIPLEDVVEVKLLT